MEVLAELDIENGNVVDLFETKCADDLCDKFLLEDNDKVPSPNPLVCKGSDGDGPSTFEENLCYNGVTGSTESHPTNVPSVKKKELCPCGDNALKDSSNGPYSKCQIRDKSNIKSTNQAPAIGSCDSKSSGFFVLSSLDSDSFECEDLLPPEIESEACSNSCKRNRHISTDSSSSFAIEMKQKSGKCPKKLKKRDRKNNEEDEVERILMELEHVTEVHSNKEAFSDVISVDRPDENANKKKKKKNKKKQSPEIQLSLQKEDVNLSPENQISNEKENLDTEMSNKNSASVDHSESESKNIPESKIGEIATKRDRKKPGKKQLATIHASIKKAKELEEKIRQEELAKLKKIEEAEQARLEALRLEQEKKEKKKQKEKSRKERLRAEGKLLTKSQKVAKARDEAALSAWRMHGIEVPNVGDKTSNLQKKSVVKRTASEHVAQAMSPRQRHYTEPSRIGNGEDDSEIDNKISVEDRAQIVDEIKPRMRTKSESDASHESVRKLRSKSLKFFEETKPESDSIYRSPVVCVLGHVDTGKTKILDKIRKTHVQDNEAGGITQQIGATMIPAEALREKCNMVNSFSKYDLQLPGLLVIDTPGHESFRNLRSRGSSLCDIAILVVDLMHGLEPQTLESIELLKERKTPFIVALNKIDRLYGWKGNESCDVETVIRQQEPGTIAELDRRCKQIIVEFAEQGLNAALFYENSDPRTFLSLVPLSAVSGDGMGNLLAAVIQLCQNMMSKQFVFTEELEATVLEVKVAAGLGTTIDVILVNGRLKETDTVVLVGQDGPIVTQIRSLLMPQPLRELRVKNPYKEFKMVRGAQGVKVTGKDLDRAIAGLPLFVSRSTEEISTLKEKAVRLLRNTINSIRLSERGVYVQASTLGSLEALLDFLKSADVPYCGVKIGPVVKKDVIKASVMLEHDVQYAAILAFDVKIEKDAQELADHSGIKVFQADIIYHLLDRYLLYRDELHEKKLNEVKKLAIFPCKLSIVPDFVLKIRSPIVIGVRVNAGILKVGTPLCVPAKNCMDLGVVSTIEVQNQLIQSAKEGDTVCVKIEPSSDESAKTYGRHFDQCDVLVSKISRQTIDVCKEYFREELQKSDWQLMVELKKLLMIT